jgi:hypothetical protein
MLVTKSIMITCPIIRIASLFIAISKLFPFRATIWSVAHVYLTEKRDYILDFIH